MLKAHSNSLGGWRVSPRKADLPWSINNRANVRYWTRNHKEKRNKNPPEIPLYAGNRQTFQVPLFLKKVCAQRSSPRTDVVLGRQPEGVTQSWAQLGQLAMLLAPKVTFSETTVPLSLEREKSVIGYLWNETTPRSFGKELLNDIRVGCFHKEAVQALTALLCSENHTGSTACCCHIPPHLLLAERCVYNLSQNTIYPTQEQKWENCEWNESLNLLGRRSISLCQCIPRWDCFRNSLSHKRALAPHGPAGPEPEGQAGCDLPLLSRTRFTHPRGIFSVPGSAPTHCRSTWHVLT